MLLLNLKEQESQIPAKKTLPENSKSIHQVSRTACFFESLIFPGWGTSRLTLNNNHFLKGVLGYAAVIGSIAYNSASNNSYNDYKNAIDETDRDDNYKKAEKYDKLSKYIAGGAAAIWTVDLLSVFAVKNETLKPKTSAVRIDVGYSMAYSNSHQLVLRLNF